MPCGGLSGVTVGDISTKDHARVGEARFVDEVPAEPGDALKAINDRPDVSLLGSNGGRIGIGVRRGDGSVVVLRPGVGRESKVGEIDRDVVAVSAEQEGFKVAGEALIDTAGFILDELTVLHPDTGADGADAVSGHLGKVVVPDRGVPGAREIPAVLFCREVVGADGEKGFAAEGKEVALDSEGIA